MSQDSGIGPLFTDGNNERFSNSAGGRKRFKKSKKSNSLKNKSILNRLKNMFKLNKTKRRKNKRR